MRVVPILEDQTFEFLTVHALVTFHGLEVPFEQIQLVLYLTTRYQPVQRRGKEKALNWQKFRGRSAGIMIK